jgi:hypothetical protein
MLTPEHVIRPARKKRTGHTVGDTAQHGRSHLSACCISYRTRRAEDLQRIARRATLRIRDDEDIHH